MEQIVNWRKASYSGTNGGNCVEAGSIADGIAVRDSQDREGPKLAFTPRVWRAFIRRMKVEAA